MSRNNFNCYFPTCTCIFSMLISLAGTSRKMLNGSAHSSYPHCGPHLGRGEIQSFTIKHNVCWNTSLFRFPKNINDGTYINCLLGVFLLLFFKYNMDKSLKSKSLRLAANGPCPLHIFPHLHRTSLRLNDCCTIISSAALLTTTTIFMLHVAVCSCA